MMKATAWEGLGSVVTAAAWMIEKKRSASRIFWEVVRSVKVE